MPPESAALRRAGPAMSGAARRTPAADEADATDASADTSDTSDLGFTWRRRKNGELQVLHHGHLAATLRGREADDFEAEMDGADASAQQQSMARLSGNYKRGNERTAAQHPRNRRTDPDA